MNMFTMPMNNKRRLARGDGPSASSAPSAGGSSSRPSIVRVDDERAKSLLRERDAKVAALEKEVVGLRNRLATLSREAGAVGGGARRRGGKELTPYGNTVRVSYSKCSARRKQVSGEGEGRGRLSGLFFCFAYDNSRSLSPCPPFSRSSCRSGPGWAATLPYRRRPC